MTSLNKFMEEAAPLPMFTPASGYTYFPPAPAKSNIQPQTALSRESSIAPNQQPPGGESIAPGTRSSSLLGSNQQASTSTFDPRDSMTLEHSFRLMQAHGDEFMDENPLRGEPGNFVFTHTKDRVKARQAEAEAAALRAKEKEMERSKASTPAAFSTKAKEESPAVEIKPQPSRKGSRSDKKRRKSRVALSPISPTTSSPATGPPSVS